MENGDRAYGIAPPGFRMPDGLRLGRVRLRVADLDRSVGWYQAVLGMRVLDHHPAGATLAAHGDDEPLVEFVAHAGARPHPARGRLGLYHFALLLPDRAALGRFLAHLGDTGERAGASDHLVSEALYLNDPDGLGIEVYADRPRETWRRAGGQLVMATDPLDTPSLLRAAGGEAWTGMPAGTRIGHVHLHVGDLERAKAFYHAGMGLDQVVWSYPGALFLSAGGYHHHLGLNTWAGPDATPPGDGDARLLAWEVILPAAGDVADAAASLASAGFAGAREDGGWTAEDPWGTPVRVVADEARATGDADAARSEGAPASA